MRLAMARAAPPADRFVEAEATLSALVNRLQSRETVRMSHSDLETLLEQQGRELMRQLLQAHLDWRAQATVSTPVVGADGVERTHQRSGTRALETLLGTVQVTREGLAARGRDAVPAGRRVEPPGRAVLFRHSPARGRGGDRRGVRRGREDPGDAGERRGGEAPGGRGRAAGGPRLR